MKVNFFLHPDAFWNAPVSTLARIDIAHKILSAFLQTNIGCVPDIKHALAEGLPDPFQHVNDPGHAEPADLAGGTCNLTFSPRNTVWITPSAHLNIPLNLPSAGLKLVIEPCFAIFRQLNNLRASQLPKLDGRIFCREKLLEDLVDFFQDGFYCQSHTSDTALQRTV
jgi:hypothetical protein